jgi:class 3 adenylate cyclase/tetratricopeptide (TPR) repeat protein
MFCNFTGPETLLEAWGEAGKDRVTKLLSEYFTAMNEVISRFGGIVSRIDPYSQGTKLLALFGAPVAHEDDAQRAISAALEMNSALTKLNREWAQILVRYLPPGGKKNFMEHRIGITLGDTFAGQAGSSTRREYTVMGDEVNLAARLMSTARPGQILISEPVLEATDAYYVTRKLPPVRVKGKKNLIPIFQVDGPREDTLLNRTLNRSALIGRTFELERGRQIIQQARAGAGAGSVLTLTGQAGIGKSHLADTLLKQALEDGWQVHAFQCRSYLTREPFSCWKGLFRSLAGITSTDHPMIQKEKMERLTTQINLPDKQFAALLIDMMGLSQVQSSNESEEEDSALSVEKFAGLVKNGGFSRRASTSDILFQLDESRSATKTETVRNLDEKTLKLWQAALSSALAALSSKKPLAVFFEDAQWMDTESKACLKTLSKELKDQSVVFLLALRSHETANEKIGEIIELKPFTKIETRAMVADILTAGLVDIIHEQSNGSPLFVEEISRWLKRTHSIDKNRLKEVLQTSDVLQKLVLSRLENLPEGQREVARLASVIGVEFYQSEVDTLLQKALEPATLHEYLYNLINAHLVTLSENGVDKRYTFIQPVFREILYTSLPFERRRELHTRMAEYLLQLPSRRQRSYKVAIFLKDNATVNPLQETEKLAYHYEMSEQWLKAANQLIGAAETQKSGSEILYNRALTLLEHYPTEKIDADIRTQKTSAYIGLGEIAIQRGDLAASAAAYESAVAVASAEGTPSDRISNITARLALLLPSQGKAASAEILLNKIMDQRPDDWKLRGLSAWLVWRARHDASSQIAACRACLPETETEDSLRMLALMDDLSGNWSQAVEEYQTLGELNAAAMVHIQLGNQFLQWRNPAEANKQFDLAAGIWQNLEFCGMALVLYRQAEMAWQARHNKKTLALLEEALSALDRSAPALQTDPRAAIQKALTRVNKKQYGNWVYWPWQPFDDLSRIHLCFPLFQETLRNTP